MSFPQFEPGSATGGPLPEEEEKPKPKPSPYKYEIYSKAMTKEVVRQLQEEKETPYGYAMIEGKLVTGTDIVLASAGRSKFLWGRWTPPKGEAYRKIKKPEPWRGHRVKASEIPESFKPWLSELRERFPEKIYGVEFVKTWTGWRPEWHAEVAYREHPGALTREEIEKYYGVKVDLAKGYQITDVMVKKDLLELEYKQRVAPTVPGYTSYMISQAPALMITGPTIPYTSYMISRAIRPEQKLETITGPTIPYTSYMISQMMPHEIPEGSVILEKEWTKEGEMVVSYMPREEWEKLPAYVREGRKPTFWEIPAYVHLGKFYEELIEKKGEVHEQLFGKELATIIREPLGRGEEEKAFIPVGAVKEVEASVGSIEALVGRPSVRSYVPTVTGALVSTGISAISPIWGGKGVTMEYMQREWASVEEHPGMLVGELYGGVLEAFVAGYVVGKAWKGAKWVGGKVGVTQEIREIKHFVKFSRVAKAYEAAKLKVKTKLPLELWAYRTKGIAVGEVALKGERPALPIGFAYGEEFVKTFPETLGEYGARQLAWKMLYAPRTGGVILWKPLGEALPKAKVLPHLIFESGKLSVGYLKELSFRKSEVELAARMRANLLRAERQIGLTPLVSQTLHTRMGIFPHIPKYVGGKVSVSPLASFLMPALRTIRAEPAVATREMQRLVRTIFQRPKRKARRKQIVAPKILPLDYTEYRKGLKQIGFEIPKQKERQVLIAKTQVSQVIMPRLAEAQIAKQREKQLQKLSLIQTQPPFMVPPTTPKMPPTLPPYMRFREAKRRPSVAAQIMPRWYYKEHPIFGPSDVAEHILGKRTRKRERRKPKVAQLILGGG